jgi:serine O-acetyltransferase
LIIFRIASFAYRWRIPLIPRLLYLINRIVFSVVLPPSVCLGRDVAIAYSGLGTVIHARVKIGSRVTIGTGVTIGGRSGFVDVPIIEDDVTVGTGAKILGPIVVGRGARIGANAVVISTVEPNVTMVGAPARPVGKR